MRGQNEMMRTTQQIKVNNIVGRSMDGSAEQRCNILDVSECGMQTLIATCAAPGKQEPLSAELQNSPTTSSFLQCLTKVFHDERRQKSHLIVAFLFPFSLVSVVVWRCGYRCELCDKCLQFFFLSSAFPVIHPFAKFKVSHSCFKRRILFVPSGQ